MNFSAASNSGTTAARLDLIAALKMVKETGAARSGRGAKLPDRIRLGASVAAIMIREGLDERYRGRGPAAD